MKYLRMKCYIRKAVLVILAGFMIGIGVYGCKKEQPVETDLLPNPGDVVINSIGMKLVYIPAGSFMMGSSDPAAQLAREYDTKEDRFTNEFPQHQVHISEGFWMGQTEITQGQYKSVMNAQPWSGEKDVQESANNPAVWVTWDDAKAFCRKLSQQEGITYRLPTEAEWEYACRAGTTTRFSFGDSDLSHGDYAWFLDNTAKVGQRYAHSVGQKKPNRWGLYDMHGNVSELCSDRYYEDYYSHSPRVDPNGPSSDTFRFFSLRGGSWHLNESYLRCSYRTWLGPDFRHPSIGFRVVCSQLIPPVESHAEPDRGPSRQEVDDTDLCPQPVISDTPQTESVSLEGDLGNTKIAFTSTKRDGNSEIYIMNPDGSGLKRLTNNRARDAGPSWFPDGKKIAFWSDRDGMGKSEIYIMNADGSEQKRLTNNPANGLYHSLSPDGKMIALVSIFYSTHHYNNTQTFIGNYEISIMNADGSALKNLTNNPAEDRSPSWSPDGKMIAFMSKRDGNNEIYVMNIDGSALKNLTNNPAADGSPSWSPDGKKIAFKSTRDGNYEVYVMNADGSEQKRLTNNPAMDYSPSWSPDGKKIAYTSLRKGNYEISVMNADGSGLKRLTNHPAFDEFPYWSPYGKKIAFVSYRDGNHEIYVINVDGSGLKRLTNNPARDLGPCWSPYVPSTKPIVQESPK